MNHAQASEPLEGTVSGPSDIANTHPSLQRALFLFAASMGQQSNAENEAGSIRSPNISWKRTSEVFTEAIWSETDFGAIDSSRKGTDERDKCIGGILQEEGSVANFRCGRRMGYSTRWSHAARMLNCSARDSCELGAYFAYPFRIM